MRSLLRFLRLPVLMPFPPGMVADKSAHFSLEGLHSNANAYCGGLTSIATAGTATVLTAAQSLQRVLRFTTGASGGFSITFPSTKAIIAAMGPTIPTDGSYGQPFSILNDGVAQTGTLTVGDASMTLTGTATILTDTRRDFFITVTSATTITVQNLGSAAI